MKHPYATCNIDDAIGATRNGVPIIIADDLMDESTFDLFIASQLITPSNIAFMRKYARGLICLALTPQRIAQLGLISAPQGHSSRHERLLGLSIGAADGITSGNTAEYYAITISAAIDSARDRTSLVSPGPVFVSAARDGGVLVRAGHIEAGVDLARLAGLNPSGTFCEIMSDNGALARTPDIHTFAQSHRLRIVTTSNLIAHRVSRERLVRRLVETNFSSHYGGAFRLILYENCITHVEHVALIKGAISNNEPTLTRMHAVDFFRDVIGDMATNATALHTAMQIISDAGNGAIVIIRESDNEALFEKLDIALGAEARTLALRAYGIGAQILLDLGIRRMILLSDTDRAVVGLDGYGLQIVRRQPLH